MDRGDGGAQVLARLKVDALSAQPDLVARAGLTALWLVMVVAIGVGGEFPLNDDFAYNIAVERYMRTGVLQRIEWTWTLIISNVAIGALFSHLFGYSMEVMRLSSLVMGWVGIMGAYSFARHFRLGPGRATVVAAVLACNPLYVSLAFTFMLDVAFTAFLVWGAYLLARGLEPSGDRSLPALKAYRWGSLSLGVILSVAAMLSRQSGFAMALALGLAAVLSRMNLRTLFYAGAAMLAVLLVYWGSRHAFGENDARLHVSFGIITYSLQRPEALYLTLANTAMVPALLGVLMLPVWLCAVPAGMRIARWPLWVALPFAAVGVYALERMQVPLPFGYNVIGDFFVGTVTIDARGLPRLPAAFWRGLAGVGLYGLLVTTLWLALRFKQLLKPQWLLVLSFTVIYLAPHMIRAPLFDRYLLPLFVPLAVMTLSVLYAPAEQADGTTPGLLSIPQWLPGAAGIATACVCGLQWFWSLAGTHDYMERNRAKWRLIPKQEARGVPPTDFNSGVEHRGMTKFTQPRWEPLLYVIDKTYDEPVMLSTLTELDSYDVIDSTSYMRWLPPMGERKVTVLQRKGYTPPDL